MKVAGAGSASDGVSGERECEQASASVGGRSAGSARKSEDECEGENECEGEASSAGGEHKSEDEGEGENECEGESSGESSESSECEGEDDEGSAAQHGEASRSAAYARQAQVPLVPPAEHSIAKVSTGHGTRTSMHARTHMAAHRHGTTRRASDRALPHMPAAHACAHEHSRAQELSTTEV